MLLSEVLLIEPSNGTHSIEVNLNRHIILYSACTRVASFTFLYANLVFLIANKRRDPDLSLALCTSAN